MYSRELRNLEAFFRFFFQCTSECLMHTHSTTHELNKFSQSIKLLGVESAMAQYIEMELTKYHICGHFGSLVDTRFFPINVGYDDGFESEKLKKSRFCRDLMICC